MSQLIHTDQASGTEAEARATYNVVEIAPLLGLSPATTYKRVREGKIPAIRIGGRWLIPKRRFHTWLDAQQAVGGEL